MEDDREFEQLGIAELAALLDHYRWEDELCNRVLIELSARPSRSAAAQALRARLMARPGMQRLEPLSPTDPSNSETQESGPTVHERETAASARVFHIRPVGTQGLPEPTPSPRNSAEVSIDAAASRCVRYRIALDQHIKDMKDKQDRHNTKKRTLNDGQRLPGTGTPYLYQFNTNNTHDLRDAEDYELLVGTQVKKCTVQGKTKTRILLKLPEDLGPTLLKAVLLIDDTRLLEKLLKRVQAIEARKGDFNFALADAAVGAGSAPSVTPIAAGFVSENLNASQQAALLHVLRQALTFIWGPPGCGKTFVLGEIVRKAFEANKRTLISSTTHKAVDQVLYSICKALGSDHPGEGARAPRRGSVCSRPHGARFRRARSPVPG